MTLLRLIAASLIFIYSVDSRGRRIDIFNQGGGDIVQLRQPPRNRTGVLYNVLPRNSPLKWTKNPDGQGNFAIPYLITGLYDPQERSVISDAMGRIEANTCIRFKKRIFERDYLELQNQQNEGCYTNVGRLTGRNVVMLEANEMATCVEPDIVVHELMHAIGLWHEHMRYDRDDYIRVHYENIESVYHSQFEKISSQESTTYGIPYDYKSVMHYAESAFAKRGKISMETNDKKYQKVIGNQKDASPSDYKKICILYGCNTCMGESFDWQNPNLKNDDAVAPPTSRKPVLPPVTYRPSNTRGCRDSSPMFCNLLASRGTLDCGFLGNFCGCSCQGWRPEPRMGFFERVFSFFQ